MKILNIGHGSFNINDMDRALAFYCDVLGMKRQFTLYYSHLYQYARKFAEGRELTDAEKATLDAVKSMGDLPWLEYLKLADNQFVELFYTYGGKEELGNRADYYGYQKVGYEVRDIHKYYEGLAAKGIHMDQELAESPDYSLEFVVSDPEGNKIHFIQYTDRSLEKLGEMPLSASGEEESGLLCTTQMAYQIKNPEAMNRFYLHGLGLKKKLSLTFADAAAYLKSLDAAMVDAQKDVLALLEAMGDLPWVDFVEVAPHQYIEFFYTYGEEKKTCLDLEPYYGYLHLCIEVEDIHKAWEYVTDHGIPPVSEISLGPDGAYQFWLVDPDGNKLELMEYSKDALQLK